MVGTFKLTEQTTGTIFAVLATLAGLTLVFPSAFGVFFSGIIGITLGLLVIAGGILLLFELN